MKCPACGNTLHEMNAGSVTVDVCTEGCGGIWFDRNEWEILVSRNLHDEVHYVFSAAWQSRLLDEETGEAYEKRIESIVGTSDYGKIRHTAQWIAAHPKKSTLISYIQEKCK